MIKFHNIVPSVYSNVSRDFQYLGWLINIVLNSVKHNVDDIYHLPNVKADPRLTELLAMTLGFKVRRNYDQKQLAALVSIIPYILKYKGTKKAVMIAGEALITASGSTGVFECEVKDNVLEVLLPKELIDTTLLIDLLPYILPAGMSCRIVRRTQEKEDINTLLYLQDSPIARWYADVGWDVSEQKDTGISGLFDIDSEKETIFTNYTNSGELNAGLLSNLVIPILGSDFDANNEDKEKEN